MAQNAHQGRKAFPRIAPHAGFSHYYRKADGMYPNAPGAVCSPFVNAIHGINNRLYPGSAEFIPKNIKAYFFGRRIKGSDGCRDTF